MNIEQLEKASETYYSGNPIMTDAEFDAAVVELRENDPDHPFLKRIGAPIPGKYKAKHQIPMGSLSNANNEKEFISWIPDDQPDICLSHKLDGSSLELIYDNGHFVQAITRGDGEVGEDVTRNVLRSGNVPLSIDSSITSVRCECLIHKDDWTERFEGDANPRNSAAGTLRRHNGHNARYLMFYAFDVLINEDLVSDDILIAIKSEHDTLFMLSKWFDVPDHVCIGTNPASEYEVSDLIEWCRDEENRRDKIQYEIDGVVAKINNRAKSRQMGSRDGRPRGQIAIKFKPRGGETVLQDVIWQVGQTGALTPVGIVAPVGVGGVIIERVTLCNMDEIDRLDIAIGDTVEVVRAGDVVPKLSKCIRYGDSQRIIYLPQKCPVCGSNIVKDGAKIFCYNDKCEGKIFGRIMTWIRKRNILNLGSGIVEAAKIGSIHDLYTMKADEWANIKVGNGRLGEKRAAKIVEALEKSRFVSLSEFLGSIGIKGVGRSLAFDLCKGLELKTLDEVFVLKYKQIVGQEGFGTSRTINFRQWLREHHVEIRKLASIMNFKEKPSMDKNGIFTGHTICFTGKSPKSRKEMTALAESAGASISSSVNSNTTILVIADPNSNSSKAVKAREAGIILMSPHEFLTKIQ